MHVNGGDGEVIVGAILLVPVVCGVEPRTPQKGCGFCAEKDGGMAM